MALSRRFAGRSQAANRQRRHRENDPKRGVSKANDGGFARRRRAALQFQTLETRHLLDGFGVRFAFFAAGGTGNELTSLNVGQTYLMRTFVQDERPVESSTIPSGILQAAFDVPYDPSLLQFSGPITLGSEFQTVPGRPNSGTIESNRLDNLNGRDATQPSGAERSAEFLFFEINVTALSAGSVDLDAVNANEPNLRAEFYLPFAEVTEFDVTGDQIEIVGGGVVFTNATNLQATEGGSSASFQVALNRAPSADVSFTITPQTPNQVTLSSTTLTFTPSNWNLPQTVQITATNDSVAEASLNVALQTSVLASTDSSFSGVSVDDLNVTVIDNDTAGVSITSTSGLITSENGQTATTQVRLTSEPTVPVTINFVSSNTNEGTVSPAQLVFTQSNWNQFQTLTLTGVDDGIVDATQNYQITGLINSSDSFYQNVTVPTITASNLNTTVADLLIQPSSGLVTRENGQSDVFNVRLSSKPNSNVTLNLTSSDSSEGVVNKPQLTFTPENWDTTQVVMVSGVNDDLIDGPISYQINITPDPSSDSAYRNLATRSVAVTNQDDDTAGLIVSQPSPTFTTEGATTTSFTVRLQTQPTGIVTINVASSDQTEGTASPTSTTFNSTNWNQPQTITITGVDDVTSDGDVEYTVTVTSSSTSDPSYNSLAAITRTLTNQDNDIPGVLLSDTTGLQVDEDGGSDTFSIRLQTQPLGNVTVRTTSSDTGEVTVSPATVTLTPQNWNQPQTITLTGVNDNVVDGPQTANINFDLTTSADTAYRTVTVSPITVTNVGDSARLIVSPIAGLVTKEAGGLDGSDTFGVRLSKQPTTNVVIDIVSSDPSEGTPTVSQITFTPSNFGQVQEITIAGVDDDLTDGNQTYQVSVKPTSSSDSEYRDLATTFVTLTNEDDDVPGLIVSQPSVAFTSEVGSSSTLTTRLQTQPTGTVSVTVAVSDASEASVSSSMLTFNAGNWDQPQTITVTGVDDPATDGDVGYNVTFTSTSTTDPAYNSLGSVSRSLTNRDNDPAGVVLAGTEGLQVAEDGSTDTFTIRLQSQPLSNVTIRLASTDTGEVTISPATLTFTPANWNTSQTVTLTGVDDIAVDGPQTANITFDLSTSDDAAYRNVSVTPFSVTNTDNDVPGVSIVTASPLQISEAGTSATFTVALNTPPTQNVTITATSGDTSEGTISPNTITFNSTNFNQPQTFTITGVDDPLVDGDVSFNIVLTAASGDTAYDGISISPISVVNANDDEGGIEVNAGNNLTVSETGTTTTFSVVLKRQPIQDVTVPLGVTDASELSINKNELLFTNANWNTPQIVTVTGIADNTVDADVVSAVTIGPSSSNDQEFDELVLTPLSITNTNIDTASLAVTASDVIEGNAGTNASIVYTIELSGAVQSGVTLDYATFEPTSGVAANAGIDYTSRSGTLSLSGNDGETMQISVPILADSVVEAHESIGLRLSGLRLGSSGASVSDVTLSTPEAVARILNDDAATLTLGSLASQSFEGAGGTTTTLTAQAILSAAVQGGITARYDTTDGTATVADDDYVATSGTLTFDGGVSETKTISVEIIGDDTPEPDEMFAIALSQLAATDPVIRDAVTIVGSSFNLTIQNDDAPRLVIRNVTTDSTEGESGTGRVFRFEVELTDDVNDPDGFTVPISTVDGSATVAGGDYTAANSVLSFNGNAGEKQTFEVTVTGDSVVEADETFIVQLGAVSGLADTAELIIPNPQLTATIENDDTASVTLTASETTVVEGNSGTVTSITFTALLTGNVQDDFTVNYLSSDGTATAADNDYDTATGTLAFSDTSGESQTFTVNVRGDNRVELAEMFSVGLSSLSGLSDAVASSVGLPNEPVTISISADDRASLSLSTATSVAEGNSAADAGELSFTVTLSNPISGGLQLAYGTADGTATAGEDYVTASGNLIFSGSANETQTITVSAISDLIVETNETFRIDLGAISGLPADLADFIDVFSTSVVGTITNDDTATLSISGPDSIGEPGGPGGSTSAVYTVSLSAAVQGGLSIGYATSDDTAVAGSDYDAASGTISFIGTSNQSQTITVNVRGDSNLEGDEAFEVALLELINVDAAITSSINVANRSVTTTITDDDSVTISFASSTSSVAETNGNHTVTVVLSTTGGAILTQPLEVDVIVRQSSTADSNDYTINTTRVVFPVGSGNGSTQTITLNLVDDGQLETTEMIVLGLQTVQAGPGVTVTSDSHTVAVTDDPSNAVLAGYVWADTNANTQRESHEMGIGGVRLRLTGVDNQGQTVQRTTTTNSLGRYEFRDLAGGTYQITQDQPGEFIDAVTVRGTITPPSGTSVTSGTTGTNTISQIVLPASGQGDGFGFTERGYRASAIPSTSFQARSSSTTTSTATRPSAIEIPQNTATSNSVLDSLFANW
ncbi:sodium:calcium exchanger [Rhodopirellula sp. ICT_H3.1]|uniref:Sodium:calcium exchanger n=2 Tax=Aporhodopirellula aestuarii TaxID=2950107 RepID=A0ABT0UB30_9BACT|nr:sodium:calcium exchanger [Aporhodopirellula aestuarii]